MKKRPGSLSARLARLEEKIAGEGRLFIFTTYKNDDPKEIARQIRDAEVGGASLVFRVDLLCERPGA